MTSSDRALVRSAGDTRRPAGRARVRGQDRHRHRRRVRHRPGARRRARRARGRVSRSPTSTATPRARTVAPSSHVRSTRARSTRATRPRSARWSTTIVDARRSPRLPVQQRRASRSAGPTHELTRCALGPHHRREPPRRRQRPPRRVPARWSSKAAAISSTPRRARASRRRRSSPPYAATKHAVVGLSTGLRAGGGAARRARQRALPRLDRDPDPRPCCPTPTSRAMPSAPVTAREYLAAREAEADPRRPLRAPGAAAGRPEPGRHRRARERPRSLWYLQRCRPGSMELATATIARRVERDLVRPRSLTATVRHDGRRSSLHAPHERRGRAHVDRREGPDPALDDRRGRAVRPAARLRPAAGAHRPRDLPDPPLPPARACRRRSGSARRAGRSRRRSTSTSTCAACASPRPAPSARCSTSLQPIASAGFDRARPLWEFTLIEGLYDADGTERAAFAMKVHHAVTDGVGGMALLALLVDLTADAAEPDRHARRARAGVDGRGRARCATRSRTRRAGCSASPAASRRRASTRPRRRCAIRWHAGAELVRTARSIGRMLAPATEPMSPVMRDRGLGRRLDMFDLSLDDLRRAAKVDRRQRQRRVRRGGDRRAAPLPRAPRRLSRLAAHDAADQPPARGRRRRRQPLRAGALRGARRRSPIRANGCRRSARSCASGAPSPRCSSPDRSRAC